MLVYIFNYNCKEKEYFNWLTGSHDTAFPVSKNRYNCPTDLVEQRPSTSYNAAIKQTYVCEVPYNITKIPYFATHYQSFTFSLM